jgi:tetratricopeptide (TPR) repeat protein
MRSTPILMSSLLSACLLAGLPASAGEEARTPPEDAPLVRHRRFSIEYTIREGYGEGPALQKVELYVTTDLGRTWKNYGTDPDRKSPFVIEVPSDGAYGFALVSTDRAGNREIPPSAGTYPEQIVIVDTTGPEGAILEPKRRQPAGEDGIRVAWETRDEHPAANPVSLYVSGNGGERWYLLRDELPARGRVLWKPSDHRTSNYIFRIKAVDRLGNSSFIRSPGMVVTDNTPPTTAILGPARAGSRDVQLQYTARDDGGGVQWVELWTTADGGESWSTYGRDEDTESPMPYTAPADAAQIGFYLRAADKVGNATPAPAAGQSPQHTLTFDTEGPTVRILEFAEGRRFIRADSAVDIQWEAGDPNLKPNSVSIAWSADAGNTWETLATGRPAAGRYTWRVPSGMDQNLNNCLLRVTAVDTLGNQGSAETPQPFSIRVRAPALRTRIPDAIEPEEATEDGPLGDAPEEDRHPSDMDETGVADAPPMADVGEPIIIIESDGPVEDEVDEREDTEVEPDQSDVEEPGADASGVDSRMEDAIALARREHERMQAGRDANRTPPAPSPADGGTAAEPARTPGEGARPRPAPVERETTTQVAPERTESPEADVPDEDPRPVPTPAETETRPEEPEAEAPIARTTADAPVVRPHDTTPAEPESEATEPSADTTEDTTGESIGRTPTEPAEAATALDGAAQRDAAVFARQGQEALAEGELTQAEALFRQAIAQIPQMPRAHVGLAEVYHQQGKLEKAMGHAEQAYAADPKFVPAYMVTGQLALEAAERAWEKSEEGKRLNAGPEEIKQVREQLVRHLRDAQRAFSTAAEMQKNNKEAWDRLGETYYFKSKVTGDLSERANALFDAQEAFLKGYRIHPPNYREAFRIGYIHFFRDEYDAARKYFQKGIEVAPADRPPRECHWYLAKLAEQQNRPDDALHHWRKVKQQYDAADPAERQYHDHATKQIDALRNQLMQ